MSNTSQQLAALHGFLMMGTEKLFLCHLPMFFSPPHSFQAILEASLPTNDKETYIATKSQNPGKALIIMNQKPASLKDITNSRSFLADAFSATDSGDPHGDPFIKSVTVAVDKPVVFEQLNAAKSDYPEKLTYYLFGKNSNFHLSHLLTKAPNFEQELDVTVSGEISNKTKGLDSEVTKISIDSLNEKNMQPIDKDPLTESEYKIIMDDGTTGKVSILNKFWINNGPLNMNM
jgi:hypothetical protein